MNPDTVHTPLQEVGIDKDFIIVPPPQLRSSLHIAIAMALVSASGHGGLGFALPQKKPTVPYLPKPKIPRQPGILDRIQFCESREAAHLLWHEFLDHSTSPSQKTINKANRLLATLDFPLP